MFITINNVSVEIHDFNETLYYTIATQIEHDLINRRKNRDVICDAFSLAVSLAPEANASDLWHHIVYRLYLDKLKEITPYTDAGQSWKRSSGDAFEMFIVNYYNRLLDGTSFRLVYLDRQGSFKALKQMGILENVGDSKLDIAIIKDFNGKTISLDNGTIIGGIHAKASLAERVSDDVPASTQMMSHGYLSYLFTLDVKSFPLSATVSETRAYINKGELGSPESPTDKRKYIEEHGSFDACISFNSRTIPSPDHTHSGRKIFTTQPNGRKDQDQFYMLLTRM